MPEDLAREVHAAYATFKQARDRLSSAVKARGYYGPPKGKGKSGKGKNKGKNKGPQARNGLSLDELKAQSVCNACGGFGHWAGDRK